MDSRQAWSVSEQRWHIPVTSPAWCFLLYHALTICLFLGFCVVKALNVFLHDSASFFQLCHLFFCSFWNVAYVPHWDLLLFSSWYHFLELSLQASPGPLQMGPHPLPPHTPFSKYYRSLVQITVVVTPQCAFCLTYFSTSWCSRPILGSHAEAKRSYTSI